jgi:hypothetical protein
MLQKTDKACGRSFIAEGQQCSKTPISRPKATTNANLTRHLLTAGGLAVAGGMLAGVYDFQKDITGSALPPEAVCPKEPPAGLYDSFKPGDLIYTTFEMAGGHRAHYSVYLGKEDGKHMVIHATAHNEGGKDLGSWLKKESFDSYNPDYSFRKATRSDKAGMVPSTEQLHKLANDLNGRNFKWNGFESNCESFARALTNDIPESLQGKNASKLNKAIVAGIVRATAGRGWDRSNAVTNEETWAKMKQTTKLDAMLDPKERAERILSPLFNNRPVTVMSVSLTPEGIPTGVFKGMVTPGISRYYTFKMGNQIEYKRIMPKGDGLTKTHKVMREFKEGALTTHGKPVTSRKQAIAIALSEQVRVKRKKRPKGEAFEKVDAVPYGIWYKNRTTPVVVNAESSDEARSKGSDRRKESYGAITAVKTLKGADAKAARRGDWVRTRASGKSPEESTQKSKIRPQFFDAEDPCWEGYEQVGMKRKGGKMVPNCVPIKEKAAFRKKAKASHPDIPGGSNEAYLKVQKAWESAQATGKFKRGDSIEMEGFLRRLDSCCKQCEDDEMDMKRRADALLARLDQKCGNSGIPDRAKCSKGGAGSSGHPDPTGLNKILVKRGGDYYLFDHPSEMKEGDEVQDKLPPEAGSAAPRKKKSGRGKKILKGALIGLGALTAANIAAGTALNVGYGIAASRRKRGYGYDSQDKADALLARLDVKCGKGAISVGEKCHSSAVMGAIAMGSAAINSQGFERSVMKHHAVSQDEAREFGRSLSVVHERGGAEKAKEHYTAWAKNVVAMAKKV